MYELPSASGFWDLIGATSLRPEHVDFLALRRKKRSDSWSAGVAILSKSSLDLFVAVTSSDAAMNEIFNKDEHSP